MAPIFPLGRRARLVEAGLSRALCYGSGAGGVPTHPRRKSFTILNNLRAHQATTHLNTYLRQRWRGDVQGTKPATFGITLVPKAATCTHAKHHSTAHRPHPPRHLPCSRGR